MGKIYNLFSQSEHPPTTHSVKSANDLVPVLIKVTDEAVKEVDMLALRLQKYKKGSPEFDHLVKKYDSTVQRWAEKVHRVGAVAKGLWLVDFDTGKGYLCWSYPEKKVEHFHDYDSGFKQRVKIADLPKALKGELQEARPIAP